MPVKTFKSKNILLSDKNLIEFLEEEMDDLDKQVNSFVSGGNFPFKQANSKKIVTSVSDMQVMERSHFRIYRVITYEVRSAAHDSRPGE